MKIKFLEYCVVQSPFGRCVIAYIDGKICACLFMSEGKNLQSIFSFLKKKWPNYELRENQKLVRKWSEQDFNKSSEMPIHFEGTPFEIQVWSELLKIPYGTVTNYEDIARKIGKPKAIRAVGTAIGKNSIAFFVPCHRVIRKNGELGGYRWGSPLKQKLLQWEREHRKI